MEMPVNAWFSVTASEMILRQNEPENQRSPYNITCGAGERNRTLVFSLEGPGFRNVPKAVPTSRSFGRLRSLRNFSLSEMSTITYPFFPCRSAPPGHKPNQAACCGPLDGLGGRPA